MKKTRDLIIAGIALGAVIAIFWADYRIYRIAHPDAPAWTYLFK